jgi:acyl-CoA synthetase (AMP-forming)/AMP-acid ligase II
MNVAELFWRMADLCPEKAAIVSLDGKTVSFAELADQAQRIRQGLRQAGLQPGDKILFAMSLNAGLYAAVLGALSEGLTIILVEPWMPVHRIEHAVRAVRPAALLASGAGRLWAARSREIRQIGQRFTLGTLLRSKAPEPSSPVALEPAQPAIISFTSGTTGEPKGVVRTHQTLAGMNEVLDQALDLSGYDGVDLCIFANFALLNLVRGRTTVLMGGNWSPAAFGRLNRLAQTLPIASLTCGPAFLQRLIDSAQLPDLERLHVGGALTDCQLFERAFKRWPKAGVLHVYGSSEAEPVAVCDARRAVELSRQKGYFQTLYLGNPVQGCAIELMTDDSWVSGEHVCPYYFAAPKANELMKREDSEGRLWHRMGDRLDENDGLWYRGRRQERGDDFLLQQDIYCFLGHSRSFICRNEGGDRCLVGDLTVKEAMQVNQAFPSLVKVVRRKIKRDRRHRARIDRAKTLGRVEL